MSLSPASFPPVSAYIPCYNNAKSLEKAIGGIQAQSIPVDDFFIVDDGSTDASRKIAADLHIRVIEMKTNQGRGAVRARAMQEARHDLVLCCDATNRLREDFLHLALFTLEDAQTAAVCGRLVDTNVSGVVGRWRARHLFRQAENPGPIHPKTLITWGTLMRKSAVLSVGNFNPTLRFGEDYELGMRMKKAGYQTFQDPALIVITQVRNTLAETMERYLRWNYDGPPRHLLRDFLQAQVVALKILLPRDFQASDPLAVLITLLMPYYRIFYGGYHRGTLPDSADGLPPSRRPKRGPVS